MARASTKSTNPPKVVKPVNVFRDKGTFFTDEAAAKRKFTEMVSLAETLARSAIESNSSADEVSLAKNVLELVRLSRKHRRSDAKARLAVAVLFLGKIAKDLVSEPKSKQAQKRDNLDSGRKAKLQHLRETQWIPQEEKALERYEELLAMGFDESSAKSKTTAEQTTGSKAQWPSRIRTIERRLEKAAKRREFLADL